MFGFIKRRRRKRILSRSLSSVQTDCIERNVPYSRYLPDESRMELYRHTQIVLAEKNFEGCGGLELSDAMRVTIAAQASVLLLHRETDFFPRLMSILVYPDDFISPRDAFETFDGIVESEAVLSGESSELGAIALSWSQIRYDIRHPNDGFNVILHEFAHQIDSENLEADGAPLLELQSDYDEWVRVLGEEYQRLNDALSTRGPSALDAYGASDPAEFFAVATESFFEKPHALRRRHEALYQVLSNFYRQDPAAWIPARQ
ncbi:MAG: hypothetical protein AMXMBFR84_42190 [Candidatus Hydrogenedentota bacterium]